jgi:hypothetical protein
VKTKRLDLTTPVTIVIIIIMKYYNINYYYKNKYVIQLMYSGHIYHKDKTTVKYVNFSYISNIYGRYNTDFVMFDINVRGIILYT